MWIDDGEKYALVGLEVKLTEEMPNGQIGPNHWVLTNTLINIPQEWRDWLGEIRTNEIRSSNLFLISKLASVTPDVLDGENQTLEKYVWKFYLGLILSAIFSPSHRPVLLTGTRQGEVITIRQQKNLEILVPQKFRPYPPVLTRHIKLASQLGRQLDAMLLENVPGGMWRFFRILDIYIKARSMRELVDRIHQFCRCIDGLILPAIGKTKQQFKSRTELFLGPGHHELMGNLYDIRSNVEHLHENRYLEVFDRGVRLDLMQKEAIVEYIVRKSLTQIVTQNVLWPHFGNTAALERFWALDSGKRREIWGDTIDPMDAVVDFNPQHLHDGQLGKG